MFDGEDLANNLINGLKPFYELFENQTCANTERKSKCVHSGNCAQDACLR